MIFLYGCSYEASQEKFTYSSPPQFIESIVLEDDGDTLQPVSFQLFKDTIYVNFYKQAKIDLYDLELKKIKTIDLIDPEPVYPTSIAVQDSALYVSDHSKRMIIIYDRNGKYVNSFGILPDGISQLSPFDIEYFGGVLYVTDIVLRKILAVSMVTYENVTEIGELILTIPSDSLETIGMPSSIMITHDGRLLAGDAKNGNIDVFTCTGEKIYTFESIELENKFAPQGFSMDNLIDPSLQDTSSFDPSGIREMGRFHVADPNNKTVHMFNPVGKYVGSYDDNPEFQKPSDVLVINKLNRIYVADPQAKRIFVYNFRR
jgi:hypothetical protein